MPVANFSVVHECPVFPNERVAIASVDRRTGGGTNMGKKQSGLPSSTVHATFGMPAPMKSTT
jgi:hypothetical protein